MIEETTVVAEATESLPELGRRIDAAYERTKCGRQEWIEGSLELAEALAAARLCFPSNGDFEAWRKKNGHDYVGQNDREALIKFGRNLSLARTVFERTTNFNYQYIWGKLSEEEATRFTRSSETGRAQSIPPASTLGSDDADSIWSDKILCQRLWQLRVDEGKTFSQCAGILSQEFDVTLTTDACKSPSPIGMNFPAPKVAGSRNQRRAASRTSAAACGKAGSPAIRPAPDIIPLDAGPRRPMTQQQIDPEFTGTGIEWVKPLRPCLIGPDG